MKFAFLTFSICFTQSILAGLLYSDLAMESDLKIYNKQPVIVLDKASQVKLTNKKINIYFNRRPLVGAVKFKMTQGQNVINLKIPRDRYNNDHEFTLYGTDTDLNYDLYMRRTEEKLLSTKDVTESELCMISIPEIVDGHNEETLKQGQKTVLNRYSDYSRIYTLSFVRDHRTEASVSQNFVDQRKVHVDDLTVCRPFLD